MGSAPKPIKKIASATTKPVKKVAKGLSFKSITKPFTKVVSYVDNKVTQPVVDGVKHIANEGFDEIIEKPLKKVGREVVDTVTGSDKYSRGTPRPTESAPEPAKDVTGDLSAAARRSQVAGLSGSASRRRFVEPTKLKKS